MSIAPAMRVMLCYVMLCYVTLRTPTRLARDQVGFLSDFGGFSLNRRILMYLTYICVNTRIKAYL